jgi:nitric oxide dioxygenase
MLSPRALPIVRQTLPAVAAAIPEITKLFYDKLFADHPELLSHLFNRGNQATGAQQQALAGSIAAFATAVNPGGRVRVGRTVLADGANADRLGGGLVSGGRARSGA